MSTMLVELAALAAADSGSGRRDDALASLEDVLGLRLVDGTGGLTDAGRTLLPPATAVLSAAEAFFALAEALGEPPPPRQAPHSS